MFENDTLKRKRIYPEEKENTFMKLFFNDNDDNEDIFQKKFLLTHIPLESIGGLAPKPPMKLPLFTTYPLYRIGNEVFRNYRIFNDFLIYLSYSLIFLFLLLLYFFYYFWKYIVIKEVF